MSDETVRVLLAVSGGLVWLVGGNVVLARYYRRQGTSLWAEWKPFSLPWTALAATWRPLLTIFVIALACMFTAVLI